MAQPLPSVSSLLGRSVPAGPAPAPQPAKLPSISQLLGHTPAPVAPAGPPAPAHHGGGVFGDIGHALGETAHIVSKTATGLASDAQHLPGGIYQEGKGLVVDVKNLPKDIVGGAVGASHRGPSEGTPGGVGTAPKVEAPLARTRANVNAMVDVTVKSLTDPHYMAQHPDQTFLSLLAFASGGAGAGVRVATGLRLAKAGDYAGAVSALTHGVETAPRQFMVNGKVMELHPSDSHLVRAFQAGHDRIVQKAITENPAGRVAGYGMGRLGMSEAEALRAQTATRQAQAGVLARAGRGLDAEQQAALRATAENTTPASRVAFHEQQIAAGVNPADHAAEIAKLQGVIRRGLLTVDGHGTTVVNAAQHPKLAQVDRLLTDAGVTIDQLLTDTGQMTEAGQRTRIDAPGRLIEGGRYVEPTPGRLGVVSPRLEAQRAYVARLEKVHATALARVQNAADKTAGPEDAVIGNRVVGGPVDRTSEKVVTSAAPVTEQAARARLAELQKQMDATHENLRSSMFGKWNKQDAAEQSRRNKSNARYDRQQSGKNRAGKASGASGWKVQRREPLVKREQMDQVLARLDEQIARNAHLPHVQQYVADRAELEALKGALTPFPGEPVDLAAAAKAMGAQTTSKVVQSTRRLHPGRVVTPAGGARADRLGAALSVARDRLEQMEARSFGYTDKKGVWHRGRQEPTGWVGGKRALPGRQHVGYHQFESLPSPGGHTRLPQPVVGNVRTVIRAKAFKGESVIQGHVPDNTTGLVARNMSRVYKYLANDELRRNVPGSDVRQSGRDVLVNTQELKNAKVPDDVRAMLDTKMHTIDELHGHAEGFDAFRERILPGLFDKKSEAATLEKTAMLGHPAPEGFKWVDRGLLGDLAKPGRTAPGRLGRTADTINAAQTAATVYFKLGHLITRTGTNAMTNLVQGSLEPFQMTRAFRLWKQLTPLERAESLGMAGHGGYASLPAEGVNVAGRVARSGASFFAHRIDAPSRFLSLTYEARKAGIDDAAGFRAMLRDVKQNRGELDPARRSQIDRIAKEANRSAIAYDRLSAHDRNILNRAVWFYPWIKGSTRFAGRTLLEHPLQSAVGGQVGAVGEEQQARDLGVVPTYEAPIFKVGMSGGLPLVTNLATVSPVETPAVVTNTVAHLLGKPTQDEQLSQMLNPALAALARLGFHLDAHGQPSKSPGWQNILEGFYASTPEAQLLAKQFAIGGSPGSKMFPATPNYGWEHFIIGSPTPRRIDPLAAQRSAYFQQRDAGLVK